MLPRGASILLFRALGELSSFACVLGIPLARALVITEWSHNGLFLFLALDPVLELGSFETKRCVALRTSEKNLLAVHAKSWRPTHYARTKRVMQALTQISRDPDLLDSKLD